MSRHNVEVYRCRACGDEVVTVGVGIDLTDDERDRYAVEHLKTCTANPERTLLDAQDQAR
jgi:hypothetical protein